MPAKRGLRILVVEDDRTDREIYRRCFEGADTARFDLTESGTAQAGIALARSWGPDCIILDYHLPDMNGLEVLARRKGEAESCPYAVLTWTAFGGGELSVHAME